MKIMLTGSNGLLGQKLVNKLSLDPQVDLLATSRGENRLSKSEAYRYESLDITDRNAVMDLISREKPDVVINTAAMTNVDACEAEPEACDRLNVDAVSYLVDACRETGGFLIHLSTDFIFDGRHGPYREEDKPSPLSHYGNSKLKAEEILEKSGIPNAILRTILVYGIAEDMSRSNIVLWAKSALEKGQEVKVVDDQWRSPTLAEDLADGCILAAKKRIPGIFHISGGELFSVLEIVQEVADHWGLDRSLIKPISSKSLAQAAVRPPKTGFILDKAREVLGYQPHSFRDGLKLMDEQMAGQ